MSGTHDGSVLRDWEMVIGLEVHAQIQTSSKLFSPSPTAFGGYPNAQVSFVDAAFPGMLPVLNAEAVAQAVRTGLGLGGRIHLHSVFERKSYFYPDLPQGYQISQYRRPLVGGGGIAIDLANGTRRKIEIERLHLEQDAGKSLHDQHPSYSYIDLNRSGIALMEIVSRPDLRSGEEAASYLRKLRTILRYLGTCDGNMEQGSLRADVNLSVRRHGAPLGVRTETKNLNSIRFVQQAIACEMQRQVALLESGRAVQQETRIFDPHTGRGRALRTKEEAHDYRYFPDPDLPPLVLDAAWVAGLREGLPELPDAKRARFISTYGLKASDAAVLTAEREVADFFEEVARGSDPVQAARWVMGDYFALLNKRAVRFSRAPVDAAMLRALINLVDGGEISARSAKEVLVEMWDSGLSSEEIVARRGLRQISDKSTLERLTAEIIADNPVQAQKYRSGKEKLLMWFVGLAMKETKGQANPASVQEILRRQLRS